MTDATAGLPLLPGNNPTTDRYSKRTVTAVNSDGSVTVDFGPDEFGANQPVEVACMSGYAERHVGDTVLVEMSSIGPICWGVIRARTADLTWHNVTLLSGWSAPSPLQYQVVGGICYWRGVLQAPSDAVASTEYPIADLPSEAQPTVTTIWPAIGRNSTNVVSYNVTDGQLRGYIGTVTAAYLSCPFPYPVN